jgi:hypothetical protein
MNNQLRIRCSGRVVVLSVIFTIICRIFWFSRTSRGDGEQESQYPRRKGLSGTAQV